MTGRIKAVGVLLVASLALAACSSSGSSTSGGDANLASKSSQKKTTTASVKVEPIAGFNTGLAQRKSEINIPVQGKITRTGEIYLLRGLANVFSRGMDTLGAKMIRRGLDARVYNHAAWQDLANNIIARNKLKQVSYPIIIMGHSLGANASAQMARYLGERGVKVSYVVGFDPTITGILGKNVGRAVNFYLPNKSKVSKI